MSALKLTIKQKRFADEYIISGNATEAYKVAGYKCNTDLIAGVEGHKLLKNPKIRAYIDNRLKELDDKAIMKIEEVMKRLTKIGRREETESVVVTLAEERSEWVDGKKRTIKEEHVKVVEIPAKLSDTNKALELIGKRYAMWTDRTDLQGELAVTFVNDVPVDDEE